MQNPLLEQQTAILTRIVSNVEKLNEAMQETNRALAEIVEHKQLEVLADLWSHYQRNVRFNLQNQGQMEPPR